MGKINIAELLKDCPKGMELYSPIFGEVYLDKIRAHLAIVVTTDKEKGDFKEEFLYDGRYGINGVCMIFPSKGKTTWEGFVPPCQFKDGNIVALGAKDGAQLFIFKEYIHRDYAKCYMMLDGDGKIDFEIGDYHVARLATEEEKQKLFKAIKENGYHWNAETKTLEKLIEPKFKVGDIVKSKNCPETDGFVIIDLKEDGYYINIKNYYIKFKDQDNYELVSNKFDINTLVPFESKVLVRDCIDEKWCPGIWGFYNKNSENYPYVSIGERNRYCIPYKGNEYLLGTTNDCNDYYKTWEPYKE